GDFSEALARLLVERGIEHCADGKWRFRADGRVRVASPFRLTAEQIGAVLASIACPYTLVRGEQGFNHIDEHLAHWRDAVPQLQIEVLPGGHHVHMEQPDLMWQSYQAFVKQGIAV
ncbi:alpha/beta hydrolase, partial [Thalassospira xiamenensis]